MGKKLPYYGENKYINNIKTVHSEEDVINDLKRKFWYKINKKNKKKFNLLNIRISKNGMTITNSRPCVHCVIMCNKTNNNSGIYINKVFYTEDNNTLIQTNINKLINSDDNYISKFYKQTGFKTDIVCSTSSCNHHHNHEDEDEDECGDDNDEDITG